jgi:hypothetical protein
LDAYWRTFETPIVHLIIEDDENLDPQPATGGPTLDENDYVEIAEFNWDTQGEIDSWVFRNFTAKDGFVGGSTPLHYFKPSPDPAASVILMGPGPEPSMKLPTMWVSGSTVTITQALDCCPNLGGSLDNVGCATFEYNNYSCMPYEQIADYEGADMYLDLGSRIDISDYHNILIEYKIAVEGLDDNPHGPHPFSDPEETEDTPFYFFHSNNPFSVCRGKYDYNQQGKLILVALEEGILTTRNCADSRQIEEMLTVLYSSSDSEPTIIDEEDEFKELRLANISQWRIVDTVPWKLLKRTMGQSAGIRYVDLGMWKDLDGAEDLNLWIRFQGNSMDDKVSLEYVKVYGVQR